MGYPTNKYDRRILKRHIWKLYQISMRLHGGSPPTAGGPSSRLGHSICVSWRTIRFPLPQISFHHFSTPISLISFHFIHLCDVESGVVGRHHCYSQNFKYRGFIESHPSTRLFVEHELRIFFIRCQYFSWAVNNNSDPSVYKMKRLFG